MCYFGVLSINVNVGEWSTEILLWDIDYECCVGVWSVNVLLWGIGY